MFRTRYPKMWHLGILSTLSLKVFELSRSKKVSVTFPLRQVIRPL